MTYYKNINNLYNDLDFTKGVKINKEWIELLCLLEKINHCNQSYELIDDCMIVSYKFRLNVFNFKNIIPLRLNVDIIGLPISISHKGYFGDTDKVKNTIEQRKGLKIILNSDRFIKNGGTTLSSFVFYNRFKSFDDYLNSLRSPYRRRLNKALIHRDKLSIRRLNKEKFDSEYYELYLSIMNRTQNPLEILPIGFFRDYEAEIYEFVDKLTNRLLGFIQVKQIDENLIFLFGGFKKEDNKTYDLYYNMLLKIIEHGIEKDIKLIEFGQTAEESKLKIGCEEKKRYLYIHHSNPIINRFVRTLVPFFSYKPYKIKHNVFKEDKDT